LAESKKKDDFNMSDKQNKQNKLHFIIRAPWFDKRLPVEIFQRNGI
jgi:hypothetical protein